MISRPRGRRAAIRSDVSMEDAEPASADLTSFRVTGWTRSKASSNQDGGVADLVAFCERKASSPRASLKIYQSAREGDSLLISVKTASAQRFAHLDGFTFAGVNLVISEISRGVQSSIGSIQPSQNTSQPRTSMPSLSSRVPKPLSSTGNCFSAKPSTDIPFSTNQFTHTAADVSKIATSIPIQPARFLDEGEIGANFVTAFFPLYDSDRRLALQNFYDSNSSFSLSVNTRASRLENLEKLDSSWSAYIKKSRNLLKITHPPARMSRAHRGQELIYKEWSTLPATRHPSFEQNNTDKWLIECHSMPGLPDPTGTAAAGVGGLIVMVHGSFEEVDQNNGRLNSIRSFDRTFIIGPGGGLGGIRVISDILSLRAYGGLEGVLVDTPQQPQQPVPPQQLTQPTQPIQTQLPQFNQQSQQPQLPQLNQPPQQPQIPPHPEIRPGSAYEAFGLPAPSKPDEQLMKETRALELSFKTRLPLEMAGQLLVGNDWDVEKSFANFETLAQAGQIPANILLQG